MRRFLVLASTLAAIGMVPGVASAQTYAADIYHGQPGVYGQPGPYFGEPNPYDGRPRAYYNQGPAFVPPPVVVNPPAVVQAPMIESQVYLAPGQSYVAPGTQYQDQPVYIEGRRYYRDCWWDWGQRRCELKPWW